MERYAVAIQTRPIDYLGRQQMVLRGGHPVIPIAKRSLPYSMDIRLGANTYRWLWQYISWGDYFTVDLALNGNIVCRGEKLVYGNMLWRYLERDTLPGVPLVPLDLSGQETRAGWEQMGDTVHLYAPPPDWEQPDIDLTAEESMMGGED